MLPLVFYILANMLIVGFFAVEHFCRRDVDAKNMSREKSDRGSTTLISVAMTAAFILIPLSPLIHNTQFANFWLPWLGFVGAMLGVSGLILRYFALTTLGRFFTRTLRETKKHQLVTTGIYQYIRHPGYLSDILIFLGAGFLTQNFLVMGIIAISFAAAYSYRIKTEEKMLKEIFPHEYAKYQKTSKRLVPFVF